MFKITTQDGRTLDISRNYKLNVWTEHSDNAKALSITLETNAIPVQSKIRYCVNGVWHEQACYRWHREKVLDEVIGYFGTLTSRDKAGMLLMDAWHNGAEFFTVPQDNFLKSASEQFDDFCEEHHLILVSINELGYKPSDIPRNIHIWKTTSDFERSNILVADPTAKTPADAFGDVFAKSLAKWQALKTA